MKMRKLFAGIAAAATLLGGMALGATSAQADDAATTAGTAAIKVKNSQEGHTYAAYKFATLTVDTDNEGESVQVGTDAAWEEAVQQAVNVANNAQQPVQTMPAEYAGNPAAYVATKTGTADEAWFRAFAAAMRTQGAANSMVNGNGGDVALNGLGEGWYLVTDTYTKDGWQRTGVNAIVATTLNGLAGDFKVVGDRGTGQGNITAVGEFVAKNENTPTIDEKTVASADPEVSFDGTTVKIGQKLTYTVKATVPETAAGYDSYLYSIQDVASKGLTVDGKSIKVQQADGENVTGYTVTGPTVGQTGETTTIITFANAKNYAGKQLVVTYNATVNDQILDNANKITNTAKASHDGIFDGTGVTKTLYTGNLEFLKYGVDADANKLAGATFNVYAGAKAEGTPLKFSNIATGVNGAYKFDVNGSEAVVSGTDGKVSLNGLAAGKYTFKETGFVAGYAKNIVPEFTIKVTISDNGVVTYNLTEDNNELGLASTASVDKATIIKVKNVKNVTQLPLTGAAGTTLFTVVALLVAGAGVTVAVKSRQRMH